MSPASRSARLPAECARPVARFYRETSIRSASEACRVKSSIRAKGVRRHFVRAIGSSDRGELKCRLTLLSEQVFYLRSDQQHGWSPRYQNHRGKDQGANREAQFH